jgi:predicted Zn-dependent peptidase
MKDTGSVVWFGARAPQPATPEYRIAIVAMTLLANGMGSRLYRRLREEQGIVYFVGGQVVAGKLWPHMFIWCTCNASQVEAARVEIEKQIERAGQETPSEQEIKRARDVAATQLLTLEMSNWQAVQYLGAMAVLGPPGELVLSARDLAEQIRQVTCEQVKEFVNQWWRRRVVVELLGE